MESSRWQIAGWVAERELWLLLIITPLLLFLNPLTPLGLALVPVPWFCRWAVRGRPTVRTPLDVPILGLLLMTIVSLYPAVDVSWSMPKLCGIILGVAVFYGLVNGARTRREVWALAMVLVLAGLGVSLVGLASISQWPRSKVFTAPEVYKSLPHLIKKVPRSRLEFNPNEVGGALTLFIPLQLSLLVASLRTRSEDWLSIAASSRQQAASLQGARANPGMREKPRWAVSLWHLGVSRMFISVALGVILLITCSTLILTQSRSAWLGAVVGLLILGLWYNRWFGLTVPLAAIASYLVIRYNVVGIANVVWTPAVAMRFQGRLDIWQQSIDMIRDFPFTGIGLSNFPYVVLNYPAFLGKPGDWEFHAHNIYLQVALDLGLPGLAAYLALMVIFALISWRAYRRLKGKAERALVAGLFCGVLAYHVHNLTDCIPPGAKPGLFLWAMLGLATVVYLQAAREELEQDI